MAWPLEFYYHAIDRSRQLTDVDTGDMDTEAMLRGDKFWVMPFSRVRKPKHLILADWTAPNWSWAKTNAMIDVFSRLLNDGFHLHYFHHEGDRKTLVTLSHPSLQALQKQSFRFNIKLVRHTEIHEQARQKRIPRDELMILDSSRVEQLLAGSPVSPRRQYRISDLDLLSGMSTKNALQTLAENGELPERLISDQVGIKRYPPPLQYVFSNIPVSLECQSIEYASHSAQLFLNRMHQEDTTQLLNLTLSDCSFTPEAWTTLAKQARVLEMLDLKYCTMASSVEPEALFSLKEVQLTNITFPSNSGNIFALMPNLSKLCIESTSGLEKLLQTFPPSFPDLLFLSITDQSLTIGTLTRLLQGSLQLQELAIECPIRDDNTPLLDISLPELEKLSMTDENRSLLERCLIAAPGLTSLHSRILPRMMLPPNCLPALTRLQVEHASLSALAAMLLAAPNARPDRICELSHDGSELDDQAIFALSKIDWSLVCVNDAALAYLSGHGLPAPTLQLRGSLRYENTPKPGCLPNLHELTIESENPDAHTIGSLLAAAPNLRSISGHLISSQLCQYQSPVLETLCFFKNSRFDIPLSDLCARFPGLKHLKFQNVPLMPFLEPGCLQSLETLEPPQPFEPEPWLEAAPKLRQIRLSRVTLVNQPLSLVLRLLPKMALSKTLHLEEMDADVDEFHLPANCLPRLEELFYQQPHSAPNTTVSLLQAAPDIQTLTLEHNQFTDDTPLPLVNSLMSLRSISIDESRLTGQALQAFLQAAPDAESASFSFCEIPGTHLAIDPQRQAYVSNTETLTFCNGTYPGDLLQHMGIICPGVKQISLKHIRLNGFQPLPEGCFDHLETLEITSNVLTIGNLKQVISVLPALRQLNLIVVTPITAEQQDALQQQVAARQIRLQILAANPRSSSSSAPDKVEEPSPEHSLETYRNYRPTPKDAPFHFNGTHTSLAQRMIIDKLCQYMLLRNQSTHLIPKLQDGICYALSMFFLNSDEHSWHRFIQGVFKWKGQKITYEITDLFNQLLKYVTRYQSDYQVSDHVFLGDSNLQALLTAMPPNGRCLLSNPWHAIAIKRHHGEWLIFDPEAPAGVMLVEERFLPRAIVTSLGPLISVSQQSLASGTPLPALKTSPDFYDTFLQEGGLLSLAGVANVRELLASVPPAYQASNEALDGLFLVDLAGRPAWFVAQKTLQTRVFTETLLRQLIDRYPDRWLRMLDNSRKNMEPIRLTASSSPTFDTSRLLDALDLLKLPHPPQVESTRVVAVTPTAEAYAAECLKPDAHRKRLVELTRSEDIQALRFALQRQARAMNRPFFYIHSPDDLNFASTRLERLPDNRGVIHNGPAGPFHDFITADYLDQAPVLFINYDEFKANDIIRLMPMINERKRVNNHPLPEGLCLIGLYNVNSEEPYQEEDFYNNFDCVEACPLSQNVLEQCLPVLPFVTRESVTGPVCTVDLFNNPSAKKTLTGQWNLDGQHIVYQTGVLEQNDGTVLELRNAPWDDAGFLRFWYEACDQGYIEWPGVRWNLSADVRIIREKGYDWTVSRQHLSTAHPVGDQPVVTLNPWQIPYFMNRFHCDNDARRLHRQDGYLSMAVNGTLNVLLTRALSEDDWAYLLDACQRQGVTLNVQTAPGVTLPDCLHPATQQPEQDRRPWPDDPHAPLLSIASTDMDTSMARLKTDYPDSLFININECQTSHLLNRLTREYDPLTRRFYFQEHASDVLLRLTAGGRIVLWGDFSDALQDSLAPFLLERHTGHGVNGQLILLHAHSDKPTFSWLPTTIHNVAEEEKMAHLGEHWFEGLRPLLMSESLASLKARASYMQQHHHSQQGDENWQGLEHNPVPVAVPGLFDPSTSEADTALFIQQRQSDMDAMLQQAPFAVLTGLSGVGKTTLVQQHYQQNGHRLHQGEQAMDDWARDDAPCDGYIVLFLDEILISTSQYSRLEGLFQNPPVVLINNRLRTLSDKHRVIAATNPLSYGDERQLLPFLQRHGRALYFTPMPIAMVYETSIKPMFVATPLFDQSAVIAPAFLDVYRFLVSCSKNDVLISPRELESMAVQTLSWYRRYPQDDVENVARHYARLVARPLVPDARLDEFDQTFPPSQALLQRPPVEPGSSPLTSSRLLIRHLLDDQLHVRQQRQLGENDAQRYGGLNGIALQGEPCDVELDLILDALHAFGFVEQTDHEAPAVSNNRYYILSSNLPCQAKLALLEKAQNEGAVVVAESINTSSSMEDSLNTLLMLKTLDGQRPDQTGFLYIGPQYPLTHSGSRAPSNALARRMLQCPVPPLSGPEMQSLLEERGVPGDYAASMVTEWQIRRATALREKHKQIPDFQQLIEMGTRFAEAIKAATSGLFAQAPATPIPIAISFFGRSDCSTSKQKILLSSEVRP